MGVKFQNATPTNRSLKFSNLSVRDRHVILSIGNHIWRNPITPSQLAPSDLERSKSRSLRVRSLISCTGVRPYVTIKHK